MSRINVLIIEEDNAFREKFVQYCLLSERLNCVFAVDRTEKAIKYLTESLPVDVALVNLVLPGLDGFVAIKYIRKISSQIEIIVLTDISDEQSTFQAIKNGATGFLLKNLSFEELEKKIIATKDKGEVALAPPIARRILRYFQPYVNEEKLDRKVDLTEKQLLVIKHITKGNSYSKTAQLMGITDHGVRFHIRNIYKKLNIHSKSELVNLYVEGYFKKHF